MYAYIQMYCIRIYTCSSPGTHTYIYVNICIHIYIYACVCAGVYVCTYMLLVRVQNPKQKTQTYSEQDEYSYTNELHMYMNIHFFLNRFDSPDVYSYANEQSTVNIAQILSSESCHVWKTRVFQIKTDSSDKSCRANSEQWVMSHMKDLCLSHLKNDYAHKNSQRLAQIWCDYRLNESCHLWIS